MASRDNTSLRQSTEVRFETPRVSGYRTGMSTTGMIGARLSRVFDIASDVPRDMGVLLRALDSKTDGSR